MPGSLQEVKKTLKKNLSGDVRSDPISQQIYSTDASIYQIPPQLIVLPRSVDDILFTVECAKKADLPIHPRGAGTGIAGGCLGSGIVIDTSRYMNRILSVNWDRSIAVCEPGVVQDDLNAHLAPRGLRLGPNTSTGNRATIGGMIGNNSGGSHSLAYGQMADCVQEVEIVTAQGEVVTFKPLNQESWHHQRQLPGTVGRVHRCLYDIREQHKQAIKELFPQLDRQVSGYNLHRLLTPFPFNPCQIITGSEGTLGIVTKATVALAKKPNFSGLVIIPTETLEKAFSLVPEILKKKPDALECIDHNIIDAGRESPVFTDHIHWLDTPTPKALLIAEFSEHTNEAVCDKLADVAKAFYKYQAKAITDLEMVNAIWTLRKAGLGLLLSKRSYTRALAFIEDLAVPIASLRPAMKELLCYLDSIGKKAGIYGHIGVGSLHIRPFCNTRDPKDLQLMQEMMLRVAEIVHRFQGTLSVEHGDGLLRSWLNEQMFGKEMMGLMKQIKDVFDPDHLLNPQKVISGPPFTENLRSDPKTEHKSISTFLDWEKQGGFDLSVDLCNGNGQCRKKQGVMCPSFQATRDEWQSTRARANALAAAIKKKGPAKNPLIDFTSKDLYQVLDLCLQCKGCKTECPSQVDMAKMKAEFLYHYHKKNGRSLRDYLFGFMPDIISVTATFPSMSNALQRLSKPLLHRLQIAPQRPLPQLAPYSFWNWWKKRKSPQRDKQCILLLDTFTNFYSPHIGKAAVKVLEAMGWQVLISPYRCCGRTLLSKGFLPQAKQKALSLCNQLKNTPFLPVIGLEPSCTLTIRDDYPSLCPSTEKTSERVMLLQEFVARYGKDCFTKSAEKALCKVHGHCYEKSVSGMKSTQAALDLIPGLQTEIIDSGCCGMAGAFGYEKEHYVFSLRVGETTLFSHLREIKPHTIVLANGTSCREQITHTVGLHPQHLAEVLAKHL